MTTYKKHILTVPLEVVTLSNWDVKIFNYALSADQVLKDYNSGAVYFGP